MTSRSTVRAPRPGMPAANSRDGFTLIELLVVLMIFGIVTAVIVPEFRGTREEAQLRASARGLLAMMNLAYSQAVTTGATHRVLLDEKGERFFLEVLRDGVEELDRGDDETDFVPAADLPQSQGRISTGVSVELRPTDAVSYEHRKILSFERLRSSPRAVRFYPDGTAEGREITLRDRQGFGLALRVDPTTARTRLSELERLLQP